MTNPKRFDDVARYQREILTLVPGYEALHEAWRAILRVALSDPAARILFVGSGPGTEVVSLACDHPSYTIDAIDPTPAMAAAARHAVSLAGASERVRVFETALANYQSAQPYHAVVAVLVGHFIADDGARALFMKRLAHVVTDGGTIILVDIEHSGPLQDSFVDAHVAWSLGKGLNPQRAHVLRQRLLCDFHCLKPRRVDELLASSGLRQVAEFFRCFGIVGRWLEKPKQ